MYGQRSNNSHKRRRRNSDQDTSTSPPVVASQPGSRRGPPSTGPQPIPAFQSYPLPVSNNTFPSHKQGPDPSRLSSISEWITKLSHEDVEQLLADAAARHADVSQALESRFQDVNLPQLESQLRLQKQLMNTFYPDLPVPDASRSTYIQAFATEEVVDLQETYEQREEEGGEEDDDDLDFPTQVENLLDQNWLQLDDVGHCAKEEATKREFEYIVNTMIDATGLDSSYDTKAHTLRTLFRIAEILIQSCDTAAIVIRVEILWFHERVLDLSRRFDDKEAYAFVRDGDYMGFLEGFFNRRYVGDPKRAIVSQMKSIMVDLRLRATRARMSLTLESIKVAEQRSKNLLL